MAVQPQDRIREQAEFLAAENRQADPTIEAVYWFPHSVEVRLVEITPEVPRDPDSEAHPFYFPASPRDRLPAPSGIALIRPDEVRQVRLPEGWGDWNDAVEL